MAAKETATEREARLKAALRDNLKRRKQAARKAKQGDEPEEGDADKRGE